MQARVGYMSRSETRDLFRFLSAAQLFWGKFHFQTPAISAVQYSIHFKIYDLIKEGLIKKRTC